MHVLVVGASGFTGRNISNELVARGHSVTGMSRRAPNDASAFQNYVEGDFASSFADVLGGGEHFDAIVVAIKEDAETAGEFSTVVPELLRVTSDKGIRVGFVGGAGTLLLPSGVGRVMDQPDFPAAFRGGARAGELLLEALRQSELGNWFFVSPPVMYGAQVEVKPTGTYQRGVDEALFGADGASTISGEDFAKAFVDEFENPRAIGSRFTVAAV